MSEGLQGLQYNREGYLNEDFRYFHLRDTAGQERDFHFHEFDKIVILISGSVDYSVEGTSYKLQPNDILLVRNHMIHKAVIDVTVPYERIIIYLNSAYVDRFAPNSGLMECFARAEKTRYCLMRPDENGIAAVDECLRNIEKCVSDDGFAADIMRGAALTQLMVQLNRIMQRDSASERETVEYNEKIADALSYINEHLREELNVDELAAREYLSRYYFMRLFKAQTGYTVHNYIRQKRLNLGARLIREGMPAMRASAECGFTDYSAFHRAFTQTFGVSPAKIKKQ